MKKTYGLPTFFAFYVFFVWSSDGRIQLDRSFIDQSSCEATAKTFNEKHYISWKKREPFNSEGKETRETEYYPESWKSKCVPASEWPF
mgnify:CR=1 FL=1